MSHHAHPESPDTRIAGDWGLDLARAGLPEPATAADCTQEPEPSRMELARGGRSRMSNVVELPRTGLCNSAADMAAELRALAGRIEAGELAVNNIVAVIELADGRLGRQVYGRPIDRARMVGLLSMATTRAAMGDLPE